jgi:hypothetical protein
MHPFVPAPSVPRYLDVTGLTKYPEKNTLHILPHCLPLAFLGPAYRYWSCEPKPNTPHEHTVRLSSLAIITTSFPQKLNNSTYRSDIGLDPLAGIALLAVRKEVDKGPQEVVVIRKELRNTVQYIAEPDLLISLILLQRDQINEVREYTGRRCFKQKILEKVRSTYIVSRHKLEEGSIGLLS